MVERIHAAVDARSAMQIVGRTDALGVKKTEQETIERCQAYAGSRRRHDSHSRRPAARSDDESRQSR
jgi:hypothetical protein